MERERALFYRLKILNGAKTIQMNGRFNIYEKEKCFFF